MNWEGGEERRELMKHKNDSISSSDVLPAELTKLKLLLRKYDFQPKPKPTHATHRFYRYFDSPAATPVQKTQTYCVIWWVGVRLQYTKLSTVLWKTSYRTHRRAYIHTYGCCTRCSLLWHIWCMLHVRQLYLVRAFLSIVFPFSLRKYCVLPSKLITSFFCKNVCVCGALC